MSAREIALRCAAAMPKNTLQHRWAADGCARERYSLTDRQYRRHTIALIRQLDGCKDDEARRLIMGRSA